MVSQRPCRLLARHNRMNPNTRDLLDRYPLPEAWGSPTVVADTFEADGLTLERVGLSSASPAGEEILGSAAEADTSPFARAYFELLERASTIEWLDRPSTTCDLVTLEGAPAGRSSWEEVVPTSPNPSRYRYARSNGVALQNTWESACLRAFWELCERDHVLRAWYGETAPERLTRGVDETPLRRTASYEWRAYAFPPSPRTGFSPGVHVAGVFGFPTKRDAPFVFGYGARPSSEDALLTATREATQLLGFLWGEPLSSSTPKLAPTPGYHLELYQREEGQNALRRWLDGEHVRYGKRVPSPAPLTANVLFTDLTPAWIKGLRVAKAHCPAALPLVFGEDPMASHLPPGIRAHPIA
jgi:ribosomal protein S12 methylthiotransferase accessory factor YcaO